MRSQRTPKMNLQRHKGGTVQCVKMVAALTEDPVQFPALTLGALQPLGTPLLASSSTCTHMHISTYSHTYAHTQDKINIVKKQESLKD